MAILEAKLDPYEVGWGKKQAYHAMEKAKKNSRFTFFIFEISSPTFFNDRWVIFQKVENLKFFKFPTFHFLKNHPPIIEKSG